MTSSSIDPQNIDPAIKPVDDFFGYVNNKWIKENPIPPEEAWWGSFNILRVQIEGQLKNILEDIEKKPEAELADTARKVKNFYQTGMNTEKANALKEEPLAELYRAVDEIKSFDDLSRTIGYLHRRGVGAWWVPFADQDLKNSEMVAFHLYQGGLGLPDRDYYLNEDEKSLEIRTKYWKYIETLFKRPPAGIVDIETNLAKASMTRVEQRDIEKLYNKMKPDELAKITPRVNWKIYFEAIGIAAPEYMIVCQPKFMEEVNRIFASSASEAMPFAGIKEYLRWHILNSYANYLSEDYERAVFDFYGRTFSGATEMKARWRKVLAVINTLLDEALGQLYVERHFSESAKQKINALVDHLTAAYRSRIEKLDWMSDGTKTKALAKLRTVSRKLGYPDTWRDYSALEVGTGSYAENYMHAYTFEFDRQMRKIGKPVDRSEWYMSAQTVNACYQPPLNEILFPAAILQPPFFDPDADDAVNFGGIGTVIGHELTHGFDDQGSLFDEKGNLNNWWTKEDKERFNAQTKHLSEQYDEYEPLPGLHLNGKLTLGENIADLGGLLIAYDGLMLTLTENNKKEVPLIDGFTPQQRFFINYTTTERSTMREEALRLQIQTDPHSPSKFRVNGVVPNAEEFHETFGVRPGDKLWRDPGDRVRIW